MKKTFVDPELDVLLIHTEDILEDSNNDIQLPPIGA